MLARHLGPQLARAARESPIVAVLGARQVGKSTLVRAEFPEAGYETFDDPSLVDLARSDPVGFVATRRGSMIFDEVQKAPELFPAVKMAVDQERRPGRFVLTGSANFLLMRQITESLAGRVALFELGGLSWSERKGRCPRETWRDLLEASTLDGLSWPAPASDAAIGLQEAAERGGLPPAALDEDAARRERWLQGYVQTYLERDLRDLAQVASLSDYRRFMGLAALRTAQVLNVSELARDAGVSVGTARNYLGLLETSFQIRRLPAFAPGMGKRLTKAPKLHFRDTAIVWHLSGIAPGAGRRLHALAPAVAETWIVEEIAKIVELLEARCLLAHWRSHGGAEVDLVIESGDRLLPIEIKSGARVRTEQLRGMRSFLEDFRPRAPFGLVIYAGSSVLRIAPDVVALPWAVALGGGER